MATMRLLFLLGLLAVMQGSNSRERVQSCAHVLAGQRSRKRRHIVNHATRLLLNRLQERSVASSGREAVLGRDINRLLVLVRVMLVVLGVLTMGLKRRWRRRRLVELLRREGVGRSRCGVWRQRAGREVATARRRGGASVRRAAVFDGRRLADRQDGVHDRSRSDARQSSAVLMRKVLLDHDLLRVLPDLRGVRAEGEPETNEIRLDVSSSYRGDNSREAG